jgi:large subunit ribosomal protein L17
VVSKLFDEVAGRFGSRQGGYTRMIKTRRRVGDTAPLVAIELVAKAEAAQTGKTPEKEGKKAGKGATPAGAAAAGAGAAS